MADKNCIGRRSTRNILEPTTPIDEEPRGLVKFEIGGDTTPFDDDEPLVRSPGGSPISTRSQTMTVTGKLAKQLFVELFELHLPDPGTRGEAEWEETARWIRYEEDVEGADHRWGRPHVAFLTFHSLLQLRYCIIKGAMMLGVKAGSYAEICKQIVQAMVKEFNIDENRAAIIRNALERRHKHTTDSRNLFGLRSSMVSPGQLRSGHSQTAPSMAGRLNGATECMLKRTDSSASVRSNRFSFLRKGGDTSMELVRKLQVGAECAQVFVGQLSELRKVRFCMVRLDRSINIPELLDAPIPIRFIFIIVGPQLADVDYHEIGRSLSTLMANPTFNEMAYRAVDRTLLLGAIDQFLDSSLVIPPGEIHKKSLLSVDAIKKALRRRCKSKQLCVIDVGKKQPTVRPKPQLLPKKPYDPLQRTRVCFGGVINDVKNRFPHYGSDIWDVWHFQCLTSLLFMFFATFAPAISFGGLLGEKVDNWMGPIEVLVAQSLCGIAWGLFSCQPMLIMAATGPLVVFEESLYIFCKQQELEFMVVRVWTALWVLLLTILMVSLEGSFLVRYVTRFTEDIFATLIALIFFVESVKFLINNFNVHPVQDLDAYCAIGELNSTNTSDWNFTTIGRDKKRGQPDTALLSAILLLGTFALAFVLRQLRSSYYLSRTIRHAIGDFGVPIAMFVGLLLDKLVFTRPYLETLKIPTVFEPSDPSKRDWFIHPMGLQQQLPTWAIFAAIVPAVLVFILIFVEVEITELLLSSKERGLRKGGGFHYDLILASILAVVCSLMGLPWMCAAAVQSLAHASSLTVMKPKAPGERPVIEKVLEQRITTIGVAILIGACAFLGSLLRYIPLATLFGIFLYLGVISMIGIQFLQRVVLVFMPQKYHPDTPYCKEVRMWRMHTFTFVQTLCLAILWTVKTIKKSSLAFPFILMLVAILRKWLVPRIFSPDELRALDSHEEDKDEDECLEQDFYEGATYSV